MRALIVGAFGLFGANIAHGQTPPLPDEGCRMRYRYDQAGNRTRREWQCWVQGEDPDGPGAQGHHKAHFNRLDDNGFVVLPNPASSMVTIRLEKPMDGSVTQLLDMTGKVLFSERSSTDSHVFDVSSLSEGSYAVRITVQDEMLLTTLIVLR